MGRTIVAGRVGLPAVAKIIIYRYNLNGMIVIPMNTHAFIKNRQIGIKLDTLKKGILVHSLWNR